MNKYKKLLGNSLVLTLGNFGSKFINFFLVPLYTAVLTTSEYGTVDIINTTTNLLIPLLTVELGQAVIRYAIADNTEDSHESILSNTIMHTLAISLILVFLYPVINFFGIFGGYTNSFLILLIFRLFNQILSSYVRGVGKIKAFALNGILMTVVTVLSNIILLLNFRMGIDGYILSMNIAAITSTIYLSFVVSDRKLLSISSINFTRYKEMVKFSLPLVPNSMMWWLINGATRYFILFFVGASGNGLFAVANKIPTIITTFQVIFSQAWQLSSFEEYESEGRDEYYTNVFNSYSAFLFIMISALLVVNKPLMSIFAAKDYFESWKLVPFLLLAVVFQSYSNFLGMLYTASKNTSKAFTTSVYGGIASIVANFVFVPIIGTIGATIATAISFFVMFVFRFFDTKKYAEIKVDSIAFMGSLIIYLGQVLILFLVEGTLLYAFQVFGLLLILLLNYRIILNMFRMIFKSIRGVLSK
ncbi:lipopolysaccharide biosynthesis protein [Aerococcus urinaeequi]|uniref:lipopolysaccharide biosynthesis protein n=1 Tax=Aerococcus urinaeequi TaxID=51665 RepID=UPI003D6B7246